MDNFRKDNIIEDKRSWDREQVEQLLHSIVNDATCTVDRIKNPNSNKCAQFVIDWMKKNL